MRPLFAFCFPCCFLFSALGIVGLIAIAAGWGKFALESDDESPHPPRFDGPSGPPSWKVMVLIVAVLAVVMWLLYEWNKEY